MSIFRESGGIAAVLCRPRTYFVRWMDHVAREFYTDRSCVFRDTRAKKWATLYYSNTQTCFLFIFFIKESKHDTIFTSIIMISYKNYVTNYNIYFAHGYWKKGRVSEE